MADRPSDSAPSERKRGRSALLVVAAIVAVVVFLWWLLGKLVFLALAWLAFSSIGAISAAESRKMRRSRH
jgi:hypothetical protein